MTGVLVLHDVLVWRSRAGSEKSCCRVRRNSDADWDEWSVDIPYPGTPPVISPEHRGLRMPVMKKVMLHAEVGLERWSLIEGMRKLVHGADPDRSWNGCQRRLVTWGVNGCLLLSCAVQPVDLSRIGL